MSPAGVDIPRVTRIRDRAIIKRNTCVSHIRAIHDLAQKSSEDNPFVSQLLAAAQDIDKLWSDFVTEDDAVLDALIDLGLSAEYSDNLVIEMRGLITFAKSVITHFEGASGSIRDAASQDGSNNVIYTSRNGPGTAIVGSSPATPLVPTRLPEIPLPTFEGSIYKWPSFRDRFIVMVGQKENIPNIDKVYYLLGCLRGAAADAVSGIPVSADSYEIIWSTLEARYNKPRKLAKSLVEKLIKAPVSPQESLAELNKFLGLFDEGLSVLRSLRIPDLGDFILFTIASRCLPASCRTLFEASNFEDYPPVDTLLAFIRSRVNVLEHSGETPITHHSNHLNHKQPAKGWDPRHSRKPQAVASFATSSSVGKVCNCCSGAHSVVSCPKFKGWSASVRAKWVREQRMCFRCLSDAHWSNRCHSKTKCNQCSRNHHSLIHEESALPGREESNPALTLPSIVPTASICGQSNQPSVLLGTALVHIRDCAGVFHTARALIDSASQISAMTSSCATRLGLSRTRWTVPVTGLSGVPVVNPEGLVECQIQPRFADDPIIPLRAWVFPSITAEMPRQSLPEKVSVKFANLALADPSFASPSPIDLLLGADIFSSILDGKRVTVGDLYPVAFGSVFGWIILGPVPSAPTTDSFVAAVSLTTSIEILMDRFWRVEEPEAAPADFTDEGKCESIFLSGTSRMPDGRFSVPLPFRGEKSPQTFHGSRAVAVKRFENLERKLSADSRLRDLYVDFMREYESLGHMSLATSPGHYIIPHHAVYRASELKPKIRVVFDASAASFSGTSLNNCLLTGPKLQQDVVDILLLFRLPRFAFTTDVCKMYRQILVAPEFRPFQHILWRYSPTEELKQYVLNTVTYGMNCAPYLAMRVLKAVAESDGAKYPAVHEALLHQTYVDDVCTGADTEEEVLRLQADLVAVLDRAGFELKKWSSNCRAVLNTVPVYDRASESSSFENGDSVGIKVLGLQWNHVGDYFAYGIQVDNYVATKRGMVSLIARVFDPLGLLAPTIFLAKHFMQRVWMESISWDEKLPSELEGLWHSYVLELPVLSKLKIPGFLGTHVRQRGIMCGFCDASERGYAAVVYLRLEGVSDPVKVSLVSTKTKLAPIKVSTIPRLELCAAVLLAKWMDRVRVTFGSRLDIRETFAWSDSAIVLSWLKSPHRSFKIFVSNRIHQIHSLLPGCQWNHIRSSDNPADCASRGLLPSELLTYDLYWKGPACLYMARTTWVTDVPIISTELLPDLKTPTSVALVSQPETEWFSRFSSYSRMLRVVAWMRRFISFCRQRQLSLRGTCLSRYEIEEATLVVVRASQRFSFVQLYRELSVGSPISARPIARLRPFINSQHIICVGGRLRHSDLTEAQKFPILLAKSSYLSTLIIRHWHRVTCHGGPRILSTMIGRQFWILSIRFLIRSVVSKCVRCVRVSAVNPQPIMADLPRSRVSECRPFSRVGIDFAGPIRIKETRLRKAREYKAYIAVFVCFVVKAVHLEVVTDLSTNAFLASLERFVARRGLPTDIYSDCGTNFMGAAKQLRDLINTNKDSISASVPCTWHFNPPSAPHFGGLWEAAVRSTKSLMTRVMGEYIFTLEEFMTILCRIEAILNSRPLTPASTDPSDIECLTPGHFLIGQPLLAIPDGSAGATHDREPLINRWKFLNQCCQAFWKQWRTEYLHTLQSRGRWISDQPSFDVGDMVVVKETNTPPLTWNLGRVTEVMPGRDGVVRVVRVQTKQGLRVRPVVKLVKLPTA